MTPATNHSFSVKSIILIQKLLILNLQYASTQFSLKYNTLILINFSTSYFLITFQFVYYIFSYHIKDLQQNYINRTLSFGALMISKIYRQTKTDLERYLDNQTHRKRKSHIIMKKCTNSITRKLNALRYRIENKNFLDVDQALITKEYEEILKKLNVGDNFLHFEQRLLGGTRSSKSSKSSKPQIQQNQQQNINLSSESSKTHFSTISLPEHRLTALKARFQHMSHPTLPAQDKQSQDSIKQPISQTYQSEVCELIQLIQNGLNASDKTKQKHVVFLLGKTGSGKSTMVHFLSEIGIKDAAEKPIDPKCPHIPVLQFQKDLPGFTVGHSPTSMTKQVNILETNNFIIVDTAGLSDTNGPKYDIANAIGLQKALHNSSSVRMVFLIKQASIFGDQRGNTLIKLVRQLVGYVKNIKMQQFIPTVTLIISHPVYSSADLHKSLRQIESAELQTSTIEDKTQRQNVLKFLKSMVLGAQIEQKKQKIAMMKRQFSKIEQQIQAIQRRIKDQDLEGMQKRIKKVQDGLLKMTDQQRINDQKQYLQKITVRYEESKRGLQRQYDQLAQKKPQLQTKRQFIMNQQNLLKLIIQSNSLKFSLFNDFESFPAHRLTDSTQSKALIELLKRSEKVSNTSKCFKVSIKGQAKQHTQRMISKIQIRLNDLLNQRKYKNAQIAFSDILYLGTYINYQQVQRSQKECQKNVADHVKKQCEGFKQLINGALSQRGLLTKQGVNMINEYLVNICKLEPIIAKLSQQILKNKQQFTFRGMSKHLQSKFKQMCDYSIVTLMNAQNIGQIHFIISKLQTIYKHCSNKIESIKAIYQGFAFQFVNLLKKHIQNSIYCIQRCQYLDLIQHLKYIIQVKSIAEKYFGYQIESIQKQLVDNANQCLQIRTRNAFLIQFDKIKDEDIKILQQNIDFLTKLKLNSELNRYIGSKVLQKCYKEAFQIILKACQSLINACKDKLKRKKFDQLQKPLLTLKSLRKVDHRVSSETSDQYAKMISRLQIDITQRSNDAINQVMKKIKYNNLQQQDIDSLTECLQKLNKLTWLEAVIQKGEIKQIIQKTNQKLTRKSVQIVNSIENDFYTQLREIQKFDNGFDSSSDISDNNSNSAHLPGINKFRTLNSSIKLIESLYGVSQEINQNFNSIKAKIASLVKAQCDKVITTIQANKDVYTLHLVQLDKSLVKINALQYLYLAPVQEINSVLDTICKNIFEYLSKSLTQLDTIELKDYKTIQDLGYSFIKVLESIKYCEQITGNRQLNDTVKTDLLRSLKRKLHDVKFQVFFQKTQSNIAKNNFKQAKQDLDVLKKYKNTEINTFLDNQLKQRYEQLSNKYTARLNKVSEQAQNLLKNQKFIELKILIQNYQKNGNNLQSSSIKASISNTVLSLYEIISDDLTSISSMEDKGFISLNRSIKKYNKFDLLKGLIPDFEYNSNKLSIVNSIQKFYKKSQQQIQNLLDKKMFPVVGEKDIKLNRVCELLSAGLDQTFRIKVIDYKARFQTEINSIIKQQLKKDFSRYCDNLQKLKEIRHDGSDVYTTYKNKLKLHLSKECKQIRKKIQSPQISLEQLDQENQKLKTLKQQTIKYLNSNGDFLEIIQEYDSIQNNIKGVSQFIISGDKFSAPFLDRLQKSSDKMIYFKIINEICSEIKNVYVKVQEAIRIKNYKDFNTSLKQIKKFEEIENHLKCYKKQNILESLKKCKEQLIKKCEVLRDSIKNQLQRQILDKFTNFDSFQEYLNIHAYVDFLPVEDKVTIQDAKAIYVKILQCLTRLIPKVSSVLNVLQCNHRLEAIKKYQVFIALLKSNISMLTSQGKLATLSRQYLKSIQTIQNPTEYQQTISSSIENLPDLIKKYWTENQLRKISETLNDIKKLNTRQSKQMFQKLAELIKQLIEKLGQETLQNIQSNFFEGVNDNINKICKIQSELKGVPGLIIKKSEYQKIIQQIDKYMKKGIVYPLREKMTLERAQQIVDDLIELKNWVNKLPVLQKNVDKYIEDTLKSVQQKKLTRVVACKLQTVSKNVDEAQKATACAQIMYKYPKLLQIPRIRPKIRANIDDTIKQFKGQQQNSINKDELRKSYNLYNSQYEQLKHKFISSSSRGKIKANLTQIKLLVKDSLKKLGLDTNISYEARQNLPILLARLFIYLSIMKSADSYYDAYESKQRNSTADDFLLQPHTIQVLSILRFIGCDKNQGFVGKIKDLFSKNQKLPNHLMQIKTGQGKSIILGIMSLLLALMGNQVYEVCYSKYLSSRDYQSFKDMFEAFDVQDRVKYGTFAEISEKIINEKGDVRKIVKNLFSPEKTKIQILNQLKASNGNRVLLVDQVDTFFSKDFYGNTYNPCTILQTPQILQVIRFIWKHKLQNSSQIEILFKNTAHYKQTTEAYKDCIQKITQQFKQMTVDVKNFNKREYVVQNGQIGYKELDGLSFNSVYGYQTMFVYMQQFDKGNITEEILKENLGVSLSCGSFSYAQMIESFDKIFGVTGTLQSLNLFEAKILQRYKISLKTFAPSVYGDSNRQQKAILVQNGSGKHFQMIAATINDAIKEKRAVLIFFEDQKILSDFQKSSYTDHFRDKIHIVTQKSNDRDFFIRKATSSQRVTLFTAPFGRGTDFVVYDPIVKQKGVYVIQTFLSQELSEQIQVKGRTARQGSKGSYQLILNLQKLIQKYKITEALIQKAKQTKDDSINKLFQRKRQEYAKIVNEQRQKKIVEAKQSHLKSIQKRNLILAKTIARDDLFFFTTGVSSSKAKISILIDSTGSMGSVITAVKGKVMDMIQKLSNKYPNAFEIQIMFYYGHDSYSAQNNSEDWYETNKLHVSQWTDDVNLLKTFLTTANANGGSEHEAIQVALHHLVKENQQNGVKKALFIGDAGLQGKLDSSIDYCVHPSNAGRYKPAQIAKPIKLVFSNLLNQLKSKGVQVDTYPIGNGQQIQLTCKQLSDCTGGKTKAFDPKKDNLAAQLEATITSCIMMKR